MNTGDVQAGESKSISKRAFLSLVFATLTLIAITEAIAVGLIVHGLGIPDRRNLGGGLVGGLAMLNTAIAYSLVDRALKRLGMSRSGKTFESREKLFSTIEDETIDIDRVEARIPSSSFVLLYRMCGLMLLIFSSFFVFVPRFDLVITILGYSLIALLGLLTIFFFYESRCGKPQVWSDTSGVAGFPSGFHLKQRFIPWTNVKSCEMETLYNTFGEPVVLLPVLKGFNGETLIKLDLRFLKLDDQERLVKAIMSRLPKSALDPWD
jgi:hypothetical protein